MVKKARSDTPELGGRSTWSYPLWLAELAAELLPEAVLREALVRYFAGSLREGDEEQLPALLAEETLAVHREPLARERELDRLAAREGAGEAALEVLVELVRGLGEDGRPRFQEAAARAMRAETVAEWQLQALRECLREG